MNFYIGNSISGLDVCDKNVEFDDELLDFICVKSKELSLHADELCNLDPYDDMEIPFAALPQIVSTCQHLLNISLFENHENFEEWIYMVRELMEIAQRAMINHSGLICIGD